MNENSAFAVNGVKFWRVDGLSVDLISSGNACKQVTIGFGFASS